jgi:hypothetical protein
LGHHPDDVQVPHEPLPRAGRYYRLTAEEPLSLSSLFVMGHFTN